MAIKWPRYRLRTLILGFAVLSLVIGLWTHRARKQQMGVAWVHQHGGHVFYDFGTVREDGTFLPSSPPPGPRWLHSYLGVDYFCAVEGVILDRDEIDDLAPLASLHSLQSLTLMNYVSPTTDFSPLLQLRELDELHLGYTGIDRARLEQLRQLLPDCNVVDHGNDP